MTTIHKYILEAGTTELQLPRNYEILTVRVQDSAFGSGVMLYAQVNPTEPKVFVKFLIVPTGGEIPEGATKYLATIEVTMGLIFHVFQIFD